MTPEQNRRRLTQLRSEEAEGTKRSRRSGLRYDKKARREAQKRRQGQ
jgi:hypothetical protein